MNETTTPDAAARITELEAENALLRAQVAGLQQQLLRQRSQASLARAPTYRPARTAA